MGLEVLVSNRRMAPRLLHSRQSHCAYGKVHVIATMVSWPIRRNFTQPGTFTKDEGLSPAKKLPNPWPSYPVQYADEVGVA